MTITVKTKSDAYVSDNKRITWLENRVDQLGDVNDNLADRIADLEGRLNKVIDHVGDVIVAAQKKESDAFKLTNSLMVRLCALEERDRFQRNNTTTLEFPNAPPAEAPRFKAPFGNIDAVRRGVVEGTLDAYVVIEGSPLNGFVFHGPFGSQAEAQCWGEDTIPGCSNFYVTTLR